MTGSPHPRERHFHALFRRLGYTNTCTPIFAHDWEDLADQAVKALATRHEAYPGWIASGQIDQDEAEQDIAAWEWLAQEWHWIVTGEGEAPPRDTLRRRRDAIYLSIERIEAQLSRGNHSPSIVRQAHLLMAFDWHLGLIDAGEPAIHAIARRNHARRREREAARQDQHPQQERNAA